MTTRQFVVALLVLVASGIAGGLLGAWALHMREVRTSQLLLVDDEDDVRARLFMRGDDPVFVLVDQGGEVRAELSLGPEGEPMLVFCDRNPYTPRVTLTVQGGEAGLELSDQSGAVKAGMWAKDGRGRCWAASR